jgi:hypothetical protein
MTKTSTRTTPGAQRAASPRRGAPKTILKQRLDNGGAGTEHGGKEGHKPAVEGQSTVRQCVPTTLDGSPGSSNGVRARQDGQQEPDTAPESNLAGGGPRATIRHGLARLEIPRTSFPVAEAAQRTSGRRQNRIWRSTVGRDEETGATATES